MSSFKQLVDAVMKHGDSVTEVSPPGFKGTVKAMKDEPEIDNPYALAHWMKKKGYKSHKKASGANKKESTAESIRVWHPIYGKGTVEEISESTIEVAWDNLQNRIVSPSVIPFSEAKYLSNVKERYTSDPEDVDYDTRDKDENEKENRNSKKSKKKMKEGLNESLVSIGMASIGGTYRDSVSEDSFDLDELTLSDLMYEEENEDKSDNRNSEGPDWDRGKRTHDDSDKSELRATSYQGSDYTNVPRPADTIITNQEDQPSYDPEPLATHAGYEDAHDELEPDGDYGTDLVPVDAPKVPKVRDMENSGERHNTRKSGEGEDTHEANDDSIDFEGDKPENNEDKQMKKYESAEFDLTAADLGLGLTENADYIDSPEEKTAFRKEMKKSGDFSKASERGKQADEACGDDHDMQETHDTEAGEVAFTKDFLHKLLVAVSEQSPDENKIEALCSGLADASMESGATLDVSDWNSVKSKAAQAYSGSGEEEVSNVPDTEIEPDTEMAPGADEYEDDAYFEKGGDYDYDEVGVGTGDSDYDYDYDEDRAEGDGEKAGPEGGREHEGKTKMMDRKGRYSEAEGSGTPVGYGSTSGPGGGSTKDLSKPKKWHGKAVGTDTGKGPGGGSSDDFGQKPADKGGSNLLPANDRGSKLGAAENPFSKGEPNPRNQKPLAAESRRKKANGKRKLDEAILLGMSSIPYIGREADDIPPEAFDDDDELKMIKRRAGMDNWWK